jgi:D-alanine transfer protein
VKADPTSHRTHLLAASLALFLASACVVAGYWRCREWEHRYIHALAPEFYDVKLQGVALQKEAFAQPDLLVLYGSSELVREMPNNATQFFQDYPTGFGIFPVGKPGATSLSILQKIASVGEDIRGRKVAFSMSPGWFFTKDFDPKYYEGNFSELQASELAFSTVLSPELKRDVARRMLAYPRTFIHRALLKFVLARLAGDTFWDHCLYWTVWPLGRLHNAIGRVQDHLEVALHILDEDERLDAVTTQHGSHHLIWSDLLKRAARFANATALQAKRNEVVRRHLPKASRDKTFIQTMETATEWTDLELLMRTFKELGAEPLFLSMPVEDIRLEVYGISPEARAAYVDRIDSLAKHYGIPLLDFHEYEKDPAFLVDFLDHLSGKGWLYYNKALDDFFHGHVSSL